MHAPGEDSCSFYEHPGSWTTEYNGFRSWSKWSCCGNANPQSKGCAQRVERNHNFAEMWEPSPPPPPVPEPQFSKTVVYVTVGCIFFASFCLACGAPEAGPYMIPCIIGAAITGALGVLLVLYQLRVNRATEQATACALLQLARNLAGKPRRHWLQCSRVGCGICRELPPGMWPLC